jgi:hypothetical protein
MRQAVIEAMTEKPKPKIKRAGRNGSVTRNYILNFLAHRAPTRWNEIINAGAKEKGWVKSRVSSALTNLITLKLVLKDEQKLHSITEAGRQELGLTPDLEKIMSFKGIHALCTVNKDGMMQASHYACCLVYGRNPLWGVWSLNGRFQRFYGSKQDIEDNYPHLTWRRIMARWQLKDDADSVAEARRKALSKELRKALPGAEDDTDPQKNEKTAA